MAAEALGNMFHAETAALTRGRRRPGRVLSTGEEVLRSRPCRVGEGAPFDSRVQCGDHSATRDTDDRAPPEGQRALCDSVSAPRASGEPGHNTV